MKRRKNWRCARLSAIRLRMLSVLIETLNDEEGLARTLASLVGGAVEGVVREVIVCDTGSTDQTHRVAEHAGCQYVAGGTASGIDQAKGDWLLLLEPGARLVEGWTDEVVAHTARQTMAARFSPARGSRTPFLSRVFSGNRALAVGMLINRRQASALSKNAGSGEAIARGLATRKLDAEIWVAPAKPRKSP
jgi:glycosyltransferase involved in cell wall biosynthesis